MKTVKVSIHEVNSKSLGNFKSNENEILTVLVATTFFEIDNALGEGENFFVDWQFLLIQEK